MKTKMILLTVLTTFVFAVSNGSIGTVENFNQNIESKQEVADLVSYNGETNDTQAIKSAQSTVQERTVNCTTVKKSKKVKKVKKAKKLPSIVPSKAPSQLQENTLSVRGKTIAFGETKSSVISKFGSPTRTDDTEYNYDFMIYADDYAKFIMIAVADDQVVGWYTDATDFMFHSLTTDSKVAVINSVYQKSLSLNNTLSVTADGLELTFFIDTFGDSTIDGILVVKSQMTKDSTNQAVLTAWEKEVFDLTNSFRVRNGISALTWSNKAANTGRLHSKDMVSNNYFDHTGLNGSTPGDRMKDQGINYRSYGENIIGGYGNALYSSNGWMNSSNHRTNLLHKTFTHLGVGYVLGGTYRDYATQNFFSK